MPDDREMPRYKCCKIVHALQIKHVGPEYRDPDHTLVHELEFEEDGYASIDVSSSWVWKNEPKPGGYYVVFEDGHKACLPAGVFRDDDTLIK